MPSQENTSGPTLSQVRKRFPKEVEATFKAERLKHETVLIESLMAYWHRQDMTNVAAYTRYWLAHRLGRSGSAPDYDGKDTVGPTVNDFFECWRVLARSLYGSLVQACLSFPEAGYDLDTMLDIARRSVPQMIFLEGGIFDRLLKQTLYAAYQLEPASASLYGYRLYLTELENSIVHTLELERTRWTTKLASGEGTAKPRQTRTRREPDPDVLPELGNVSKNTAAKALGCTTRTINRYVANGRLSLVKGRYSNRYKVEDIRALLATE